MPTKLPRIAVTRDAELGDALERVRPHYPAGAKTATVVHDLAVRGAQALVEEKERRKAEIERFIARSTAPDPGFDVELLKNIDQHAWRREG